MPYLLSSPRTFFVAVRGRIRLLAALSVVAWMAWPWAYANASPPEATKVVSVNPRDKATGVDRRAPVQLHFSNGLKLATLTADAVRLLTAAGIPVPATLGSDLEGDVVTLLPPGAAAASDFLSDRGDSRAH